MLLNPINLELFSLSFVCQEGARSILSLSLYPNSRPTEAIPGCVVNMNRRGPLSKLVGGGIGFAREYQADRNARKEAGSTPSQQDTAATPASDQHLAPPHSTNDEDSHSSASDYDSDSSADNEEWAQKLDEAQSSTLPAVDTPQSETSIDNQLDDFMRRHPPPAYPSTQQPAGPLSMPVIIPQRRPMQRHRGFIRAYAPVLQSAHVPQPAFLEFLDGFEKSIKANPLFHVLNVAVWIAGKVRLAVEGTFILPSLPFHLHTSHPYIYYHLNFPLCLP